VTLDLKNRVELQGTAQLADPYPYTVNGTIALTDLAVFDGLIKNLGQPTGLSGALNGSFSITGDAQHPGAQLQLSGDQFKYRDFLIPNLQIRAAVEDAKAELQTCRVTLDQNDFVEVTGNLAMTAPNAYQARGEVALRDLGVFNGLLKSAGQPGDLVGSLNIDISGQGDLQNPAGQLRVMGTGIKYRGVPVQNLDLEAQVGNSMATIQTCRINLDAANFIDLNGDAGLHDPYTYKANGTIELNDL